MVVVCCCMTHHEEHTEQNYKKTVVFQLAIGKIAGTVRSLVQRYWEVPPFFPMQLHLNKGAVVGVAQNQHYTSLQISILNDFLFTTEFHYVLKNE